MRRKRGAKRSRILSILLAAGGGYLIGTWNATAVRQPAEPSPAQTVALRFPQDLSDAPVMQAAYEQRAAAKANVATANVATAKVSANASGNVLGDAQLALFEPKPMIALSTADAAVPADLPQAAMETADLAAASPALAERTESAAPLPSPKPHPITTARLANRPGYLLDDAQIVRIKQRLHLTADQQRMWPAVEAALRNIAFAKARGTPGTIDPDSAEVADLKSAAIPLLMSFSDEQKSEVRSLAHVMGLDQLASQF